MRIPLLLRIAPLWLAATAAGQTPTPLPKPSTTPAQEYRVGVGDVLEVTVFGNEDLTRTVTVQTSGAVTFPLLGDLPVAGLTVPEIQRQFVTLLARDYLVNPQVAITIKEYQSQFVMLVGEVNHPGRQPLRGQTRLIDALVEAGGFTPHASGEILITRTDGTFGTGQSTLRMRLGSSNPSPQDQVNVEVPLRTGDIITASPKFYVTVEGEVSRPGRYPIEGDLTLTGAIATAGGRTRFASGSLEIARIDPQTGKTKILKVDLGDVQKGRAPDPLLQPNDRVTVSRRLF